MGISYLAEVFEGPLLDGWVEASQLRIIPVDQHTGLSTCA